MDTYLLSVLTILAISVPGDQFFLGRPQNHQNDSGIFPVGVGPYQLVKNQVFSAVFQPVLGLKSCFSGAKREYSFL
jgi:hypothetical protein